MSRGATSPPGMVDVIVTDGFHRECVPEDGRGVGGDGPPRHSSLMLAENEPETEEKIRPQFSAQGRQADGRPARRRSPGGRQGDRGHCSRTRPQFGRHPQGAADGARRLRCTGYRSGIGERFLCPLKRSAEASGLSVFRRRELLLNALTHQFLRQRRWTSPDNERLEFLGDTVLQTGGHPAHLFGEYALSQGGSDDQGAGGGGEKGVAGAGGGGSRPG